MLVFDLVGWDSKEFKRECSSQEATFSNFCWFASAGAWLGEDGTCSRASSWWCCDTDQESSFCVCWIWNHWSCKNPLLFLRFYFYLSFWFMILSVDCQLNFFLLFWLSRSLRINFSFIFLVIFVCLNDWSSHSQFSCLTKHYCYL